MGDMVWCHLRIFCYMLDVFNLEFSSSRPVGNKDLGLGFPILQYYFLYFLLGIVLLIFCQ